MEKYRKVQKDIHLYFYILELTLLIVSDNICFQTKGPFDYHMTHSFPLPRG